MAVRSQDVSAFYELLYNPKYTPNRSANAHVEEMLIDGEPKIILIKEPAEYFEIDKATQIVWNLLDGNKTPKQIWEEAAKTDESLTEKDVREILVSLAEESVLEGTEPEIEEKRVRLVSSVELDITVVKDSSIALRNFFKVTRKLIHKIEFPIAIAIVLVGLGLSFENMVQIFSNPVRFEILGSTLLGLLFYTMIVLLPVYAIHELSHAAVCDYYGGKPHEIGTGFYYFAPFFYCDTSDGWRLSRRARIMISVAGPLSTVLVGSLFTFLSYLPNLGFGKTILIVCSFFCFYGTLINFSPIMETDGYYIVSDVLNFPNLRDETFAYIKRSLLRLFGRPVKKIRYNVRKRRTLSIYSLITVAWLGFFGYTTVRLTYFYSLSAYASILILARTIVGTLAFSLTNLAVSVGSLFYYFLLIAGYFIMGAVAYRKLRVRGVKLETINDKRVSIFLPLPAFFRRERALKLSEQARAVARKFTRSFSVVWEAPFCLAALRLGKVDQSLDDVRKDMASVERSFRSVHNKFLSTNIQSFSEEGSSEKTRELLIMVANQFPAFQRRDASAEVTKFLNRQDKLLAYVIQSSFGNVWTLEFSPDDYKRIRKQLFPSLIAEDNWTVDLDPELEDFKRHTILGLDALSNLSSELRKESSVVSRNLEQYQASAFVEPIRSRLVFMGRTEGIERSIVWIGGLFLYQAWTGYISEVLYESAIALSSVNQAPYGSLGKLQISKLSYSELEMLSEDLKQLEQLRNRTVDALARIRSSYTSAKNFHESLVMLLEDQSFDIGLYKPILRTDEEHLKTVGDKINVFEEEFEKAFDGLAKTASIINEQLTKVAKEPEKPRSIVERLSALLRGERKPKFSPSYYDEIRRYFAIVRLVYPVLLESDVVI